MAMNRVRLNQAFREVVSMEFADIPCDEKQIQFNFSDKFTKKMEKLIECQKMPYWKYVNTVGKRIAIVAILLLSITVTALGNESVKASMLQWCEDIYEEYIRYYFEGDTTKRIEYEYQLMYVPEGFEKVYEQRDEETVIIGYENESGDYIQFEQHATVGYDFNVDNEKGEWSNILIGDEEVRVYEHPDLMYAIWIENGYSMHIMYHGCQDIKIIYEMIKEMK